MSLTHFHFDYVIRDYRIDDYNKSFQKPEWWKFLWDNNGLKLIASQVNSPSGR